MKDNTKKTLKYYWKNATRFKVSGILAVLSIMAANIFNSFIPVFFKNFFNLLASEAEMKAVVDSLIQILMVIGLLSLGRWLAYRISNFSMNFFETGVMGELSKQCFAYLHKHSFAYFADNFTGSMVKRVKSFVSGFEVLCDQFLFELLPTATSLTVITIILIRINVFLALGLLLWVLLILIINWIFTKYKLKFDIEKSEAETKSTGYLADTITNSSNVKLFNGYKFEVKSFSELTDILTRTRKVTWDLAAKFEAIQAFLTVFLQVGIFYLAVKLWMRNILTVGDFVLIQSYVLVVVDMAWHFGKVIRRIYEYLAEAEEMTIALNMPHEIKDVIGAKELKIKEGRIEYKKVSFHYDKEKMVVKDLDLVIKAKETIALIGPSGAGKTTLIKLLLRMHDLSDGKILIDGQDIAKVTQESLREVISLVPQDPVLFHRTLLENIRYGKFDASDEEVIEAAKLANCHEFISGLKAGYDTYVGERGIKLSGGERQRVAIARAILRNTPILILDEATSSLDSESEGLIQDALNKLMKDKTVIIIAHRLSTIKKADRIVVVDNGMVVEEGKHEKLIEKDTSIYKKLWNLQVGGFIK